MKWDTSNRRWKRSAPSSRWIAPPWLPCSLAPRTLPRMGNMNYLKPTRSSTARHIIRNGWGNIMKQLMVIVCTAMVLMGCGKKHESPTSGSFGHEANEKYNDDLNKADAQKQ